MRGGHRRMADEGRLTLMQSIIAVLAEALPCDLRANRADLRGEGAVYTLHTTYYNAARREARLKVSFYALTMARAIELETAADEAIVRLAESGLTPTVTRCVRNGGGYLDDGDWHVRIAYYDITIRR